MRGGSRIGAMFEQPVWSAGVPAVRRYLLCSGVRQSRFVESGRRAKHDNAPPRHNSIDQPVVIRSEEHTSELQSLMRISYAVFCLKKKTTKPYNTQTITHHNH